MKDIGFLSSLTADRSSSGNHSHLKKKRKSYKIQRLTRAKKKKIEDIDDDVLPDIPAEGENDELMQYNDVNYKKNK